MAIHNHVFENGLTLVAEPLQAVESVAFSLMVPVGAASDPTDRAGLSSLTCELMLRGAGDLDHRQFIESLEHRGVERGESVSVSHTTYSAAMLPENFSAALDIYADLLLRPLLPEEQLEPSRMMAIQELVAIDDEPAQKLMQQLRRRHYPDPWGRNSQGDMPGLQATTVDDIRSHFEQSYRPQGTIIGVAGKFDWEKLREDIGHRFGGWNVAPLEDPVSGVVNGGANHVMHESNQTQIGIAYNSVPYSDPDYFRAWGAVGVLSGGMSSRLFTEVREKRGLCYSVYATMHALRDRGSVLCYAGTSAERAQETLDVTVGEILRLTDGIETDELKRLKARIKSSLLMQQESSSSRSSALARDWYHLGRSRTLEEVGGLVDELTEASINDYLKQNPPCDFTVVTLGSEPLEVPVAIS